MLRRIAPVFLVIILAGLFLPFFNCSANNTYEVNGQDVRYTGFVPCGKCVEVSGAGFNIPNTWSPEKIEDFKKLAEERCGDKSDPLRQIYLHCQLCHFFVMIDGIISFVLIYIVPPLAVLMLVAGGLMLYFGGVNPNLLTRGKTLMKGVLIGLALVYGAYMIVGIILTIIGAADVNPIKSIFNEGVFSIDCAVKL